MANSFLITLQKNNLSENDLNKRLNVKNITHLDNFIKKDYNNVLIEIKEKPDLIELNKLLKETGKSKINIIVKEQSKTYQFSLKTPRKFNFDTYKDIKNKEYVKKISF